MAESQQHIDLVKAMSAWVQHRYVGACYDFYVLTDLPDSPERPEQIGGFRPDLIARASGRLMLVGEAKTVSDLETPHTEAQLAAFLDFLAGYPDGVFVMAVPWEALASARNLVVAIARARGAPHVELQFVPS